MTDKGTALDSANPVGAIPEPIHHMPGLVWGIGIAMIVIGFLTTLTVALFFRPIVPGLWILLGAVPIAGVVELALGIGILLRYGWSYRGAVIWKWIQVVASGGCILGGIVSIALFSEGGDETGIIFLGLLWILGIPVAVLSVPLLVLLKHPSVTEAMCRDGSPRLRGVPRTPEDGGRTTTAR